MDRPNSIALSLVAHTNVGKTTLARTLLGRDIGEVRDEPHVTEFADVHTMLESPEGDTLEIWDTPGFGDSVRLLRRLRQSNNPIGWFLSQVWDRWRERPFWAAQQALKNVRDEADVLLYLVSASESPQGAGYVKPELELLAWTGKPVIVLLNQLGTPRADAGDDVEPWRRHIAELAPNARVLSFDAFARCWVQEIVLLDAIGAVLPEPRRPTMTRLVAAWRRERLATFAASMAILAESLTRVATARVVIEESAGLGTRLRRAAATVLRLGDRQDDPGVQAQARLGELLGIEVRESTAALIRLHRLEGESTAAVLASVDVDLHQRIDAGWAAVWGGAVSGALAGLSTDVMSGGLTLGGGMIAGGVLGALGAAGIAEGVNRIRGTDRSWVGWKGHALMPMVDAALLRYLAVAHFGRGRGRWADAAAPEHWAATVHAALEPHRELLATLWRGAEGPEVHADAIDATRRGLQPLIAAVARDVLLRLYPDAAAALPAGAGGGGEIDQPEARATP
ncbi:MAG TPA: DUF3482 domain-containing protein [Caldimonas sp.]|jgi:hypothetical protein|nr:DUF3482 domain-containing protein [Caldimonas sp.]HEX2542359.1 DUF3482 domain-containing protein [Caldimonas sp.]